MIFYAKFLADLMLQDYMKSSDVQLKIFFKGIYERVELYLYGWPIGAIFEAL